MKNGFVGGVPRWFAIIVLSYIALAVTSTMGVALLSYSSVISAEQPDIVFTNEIEYPQKDKYCPGETLQVNIHWKIVRPNSVMREYDSWFSVDKHSTIYSQLHPNYLIMNEDGGGVSLIEVKVPDLPPGSYEYRRAVESIKSKASIVRTPFTVAGGCP